MHYIVYLGLFRFETQSASAYEVGRLKMLTMRLLLLTYTNILESIFIVCALNITSLHFKLAIMLYAQSAASVASRYSDPEALFCFPLFKY